MRGSESPLINSERITMKLTEIYTSILVGIGLAVDTDYFVKTSNDDNVTLNITKLDKRHKLKLKVINRPDTEKAEPADVVRFHPLGESIFDPPSEVNRFFVKQMENDFIIRIAEVTVKLASMTETKKAGGDLTSKQMNLLKGIPFTKSGLNYFTKCLGTLGSFKKPQIISITNKRSYEIDDVKHSRACLVEVDPLSYSEKEGIFNVQCDSANNFKMAKAIFDKILPRLETVAVSNIKSSPTFISMLHALAYCSKELNSIANALWKTNTNPVYRDVSWVKQIDDLPELYKTEHPVQYLGNVGQKNAVLPEPVSEVSDEEVNTEEVPVKAEVTSEELDTSILPQSVTDSTPQKLPVTEEPVAEPVNDEVSSTSILNIDKEEKMFDSNVPMPRVTLGSGNTNAQQPVAQQQSASIFDAPQQQQQMTQQPVQQPVAQPQGRIVSDDTALEVDKENVNHLKAQTKDTAAARENATTCHALDLHGQPLFRYDGQPYIIKGSQPKVNMIQRSDLDGTFLFKSNGDPLLGPLTYKQDGTPNGIRNVGRIGQNRNGQQQQQGGNLFNNQQQAQSNSLASRLQQQNQQNTIFGNQNQQTLFNTGAQLTQQQIAQLQRMGIPDQNIQAYMQTGDKRYLDRNNTIGSSMNNQQNTVGGLSAQDSKVCMEALVSLFNAGKIGNEKALQIKRAIEAGQLQVNDAKKLVQMARGMQQQSSGSIFDDNAANVGNEPNLNML